MNQAESEKLLRQYYRISNTIVHFQNIPLSFDGTTPLRTASIHLCEEGQRIYDGHEKYHEELYGKLNNLMDSYTVEGLASIEKFLDQIEESMLDYKSKV